MQAVPHLDVSPNIHFEDEAIDLRQYLSILSNYKWSILGITFVVSLLTALYTYTIVPTYTSAATILIETEEENIVSIEEVYGISSRYYEYFETQLQIIKSRDLAEQVIDNLKLVNHPEFDPNFKQPDSDSRFKWRDWNPVNWLTEKKENSEPVVPLSGLKLRNALVANFFSRLTVNLVPDTHLISIRFDAYDPKLTAQVPNELANVYINSGLEAHLESTRKASEWITNQLDDLKQKVDDSERALQKFLDEEQLVDAQGVNSLAVKQLDDISEKLVEARRNRSEVEEVYRQITALRGQPIERFESIPAVLKDPMVHQSKTIQAEAERKVSELSKRYGPKHPKMIAAKAELATAKESVKTQILNVVDSVKKEYSVARAEESHLAGAMKSTKGEISLINRKGNELKTLEKEVESNRQLYDMFLTRFKETSATDDLQSANARIIDLAVIP